MPKYHPLSFSCFRINCLQKLKIGFLVRVWKPMHYGIALRVVANYIFNIQ